MTLPVVRPRSQARYFAFLALYQFGATHEPVDRLLGQTWTTDEGERADTPIREFSTLLARLAIKHLDTIDRLIEEYAPKRALHRIPMVELALLRLGGAELLYVSDVPPVVTIDEMVEFAKQFGADESPAFINAVLDRMRFARNDIPESEKAPSQWALTEA